MSDESIEGTVRVTHRPREAGQKLGKAMVVNGWTPAQYAAGGAACYKRARGEALSGAETIQADRFTALMAALTGELFDVTGA